MCVCVFVCVCVYVCVCLCLCVCVCVCVCVVWVGDKKLGLRRKIKVQAKLGTKFWITVGLTSYVASGVRSILMPCLAF